MKCKTCGRKGIPVCSYCFSEKFSPEGIQAESDDLWLKRGRQLGTNDLNTLRMLKQKKPCGKTFYFNKKPMMCGQNGLCPSCSNPPKGGDTGSASKSGSFDSHKKINPGTPEDVKAVPLDGVASGTQTLSSKRLNVMKIDEKLWTEPYGSTKMLEENPFSRKFLYPEEYVKTFIKDLKEANEDMYEQTGVRLNIDKLAGPRLAFAGSKLLVPKEGENENANK